MTVDRRKAWITLTIQYLQQLSESYESQDVTACRGLLILLAAFFKAISKSPRSESKENEIDMTVFLTAAAGQEFDTDKKPNLGSNRSRKYTFETSSSIGSVRARFAKDFGVSPLFVQLQDANGITIEFFEDDDVIAAHSGLRVIDAVFHNKVLLDPNSTGYRTHLPAMQPFEDLSSDQIASALLISSNWQAMVLVNQLLCGESIDVSEQAWHVLKLAPLQPESSAQLSIGYGSDWTACFGLGVAGFSLRLLRPLSHALEVIQNLEERRFLQWCTSFIKTGGISYLIDTLETITQQDLVEKGKESLGLLTVLSMFQFLLRIISPSDMLEMAKNAVGAQRAVQALRCFLRISLIVCVGGIETDSSSTKECKVQIVRLCFRGLSLKTLWPESEPEILTLSSSLDLSAALTTAPLELRQALSEELVSLCKDRGAMLSMPIFELLRPALEATSCESLQLFTLVLSLIDAFSVQDKNATASTLLALLEKKIDVKADETHEEIGSTSLNESLLFMFELTLRVNAGPIPLEPAFARKLFCSLFARPQPGFKSTSTREAAFKLLATLCERNDRMLREVITMLSKQHDRAEMILDKVDTGSAACRSQLGVCGITNPGCVCYICSTIQILFTMPSLRQAILDITPCHFANALRSSAQDFEAVRQLQSLFLTLQEGDRASADISLFCKNFLDLDGKPTSLMEQADASEFLLRLLQRVEATFVDINQTSVLQTAISCELIQEISADDGKLHSTTKERSYIVSVDIDAGNLAQSLENYTSSEIVDYVWEISDPSSEIKTKKLFQTSKTTRFSQLPLHLMFHLKRFTFDMKTFQLSKVHTRFEFPVVLDMFPYTIAASEERKRGQGISQQCLYELSGVVVHAGQFSSGHYYAYIREEGKNSWLEVNDSWVGRFDATNMEAETFGEDAVRGLEVASCAPGGYSVVNAFASALGFDTRAKPAAPPSSSLKTRSAFILVYNRVPDACVLRKATIPTFLDAVVRDERNRFFRTKYLMSPAYLDFAVRSISMVLKNDPPPVDDDVLLSMLSFYFGTLLQARVYNPASTRDELRALVTHLAPLLSSSLNGRGKVALGLISTLSVSRYALALCFSRLESKEDKAVVGVVNLALVEVLKDPANWGSIVSFLSALYSPTSIADARTNWTTSVSFWEPLLFISSSASLSGERMAEVRSLFLESALGHFLSDGEMFENAWEGVEKVSRARSHLKRLIQCISNLTDVTDGQIHDGLLRSDKFRERLNRMLVNAKVREDLAALVKISDPDSFLLKRRVNVRFSDKTAFEGVVRGICMDGEDVVYTISFDDGEIKDFRNFPVERIWALV
jgi:ubiquitin C-terminal hydrolase